MAKYIALSDIHLGQNKADKIDGGQFCTLSQIPSEFDDAHRLSQQTLEQVAARVNAFSGGEAVTMVVVGDLLDLSLAFVRESIVDLLGLLERLPSVSEMVYVIGNHDHHIWSLHSEWERSIGLMQRGELPESGGMYRATSKRGERHHMLSEVCTRQLGRPMQITVAYPTYALEHVHGPAGQETLVYFTHGHLFGGLYTTFSDILDDRLAHTSMSTEAIIATVNAPLIQFLYWSLSQAGDGMGADGLMEQVYADLQRGKNSNVRDLVERAVDVLIPGGIVPLVPDSVEQWIVVAAAMHMIEASDQRTTGSKSKDRHCEKRVTRQRLKRWIDRVGMDKSRQTHLVYGHTHVADHWQLPDSQISSYNLGSWLVEPGRDTPQMQLLFIEADGEGVRTELQSL